MTISELKAILSTLPDDLEIKVSFGPHGGHDPELFVVSGTFPALIIVPSADDKGLAQAKKHAHWHHIKQGINL